MTPATDDSFERAKAESVQGEALPEIQDNPRAGVLWYIFYTLKMTSLLYVTKGLYALNPDIAVLQVTSMKAVASVAILALVLNRRLKEVMYDKIDPESVWALAFKSVQSTVSVFIQYNAMKYFSVSMTGIVTSLTPLIACILAALMLKERLSCWTIASVLVVLTCVLMIILGA